MANIYKAKARLANTKPGKASGKATNYDAVITDPGYGSNKPGKAGNTVIGKPVPKPRTPGNTDSNDRMPLPKPGTAGKKVKVTPVTNSSIGTKLNARVGASLGGSKLASGKPTYDAVITDPGYGKKPGFTTKPKPVSGKAPVVYETPGFKPTKKTSKK